MKILILGDIGASASNVSLFCGAESDLFSAEILKRCSSADIVLLNLEKPLADVLSPLGKCSPDYIAPTESVRGILLLKPTAVTLANNHILDQGQNGLISTVATLEKNGIRHVGTGKNTEDARTPLVIEHGGMKIGIYACCEKEFSFATENQPGANIFDPLNSPDDIAALKAATDHVIVLFHGGMQEWPYPTPYQRKICRKMCEKGADLVVCQHSHIIGCEEHWHGARIVYGQGNFLLDEKDDENWRQGLMIEDTLNRSGWEISYIPTCVRTHRTIMHPNSEHVMAEFQARSGEILDEAKFNEKYRQLCKEKLPGYLLKLSGKRGLTQRIIRRLGLQKMAARLTYDIAGRRMLLDYLYCDAHREAIETGLEQDT